MTMQDDLPRPTIRLERFLAILRVLAGRRGWSRVVWTRGGFEYDLRVRRTIGPPLHVDHDDEGPHIDEALEQLRDALDG